MSRIAHVFAVTVIAVWTCIAQTHSVQPGPFTSSEVCGTCHEDTFQQWRTSFHSKASTDSLFWQFFKKAAEDPESRVSTSCLTCHAPVATVTREVSWPGRANPTQDMSPGAREGVTCDFCHTISGREFAGKDVGLGTYRTPRAVATETKYGPHADAATEAHKTTPDAFLKDSAMCGICHKFTHPVSGSVLQDTYAEWYDSPYRRAGRTCQDCHMPAYKGQSAPGAPERLDLKAHVFRGGHSEMVKHSASVTLWAKAKKNRVSVTALVSNVGAGHFMPTGVPGLRELWLNLKVKDEDGKLLFEDKMDYGLELVDGAGNAALPWQASRIVRDTRIAPQKSRKMTVSFTVADSHFEGLQLSGTLYYRLLSERAARLAGLEPSPAIEIAKEHITFSSERPTLSKVAR